MNNNMKRKTPSTAAKTGGPTKKARRESSSSKKERTSWLACDPPSVLVDLVDGYLAPRFVQHHRSQVVGELREIFYQKRRLEREALHQQQIRAMNETAEVIMAGHRDELIVIRDGASARIAQLAAEVNLSMSEAHLQNMSNQRDMLIATRDRVSAEVIRTLGMMNEMFAH
jgi:hypothetical protein